MAESRRQAEVTAHDPWCECESCQEIWRENQREIERLERDIERNKRAITLMSSEEFERWLAQEPPSQTPEVM